MAKLVSQKAKVSYNMGPKRPNKPDQSIVDAIQGAVTNALGPGYSVSVVSGQENPGHRHGSNRHGTGMAADIQITDPSGNRLTAFDNKQEMLAVAEAFKELGGLGVGIGTNYMGGVSMHLDMVEAGPGQDNAWGNIGNANQARLETFYRSPVQRALPDTMQAPLSLAQSQLRDEAIRTAFASPTRALDVLQAPSAAFSQPSRPQTLNPPSRFPGVPVGAVSRAPLAAIPASLTPAPVGRVERAPLSPVVPGPQIAARPAFPGSLPAARPQSNFLSRPAPPATSLPAARPRSLAHPVSVAKPSNLPAAPVGQVTKGPALAPAGPNASTLAAQYAAYQPSKATSMPTVTGMPTIPAPTGLPAAPAQPLAHPVSVPAVQAPPAQVLAPALVPNYARPAPAPSSLPAAPPAATASDVYSGLATQAKDNTGLNTVGMLPDGTTTVTNRWGVTTGMTPYGKQTAVGNLPGIAGPVAKTAAKVGIPAIGSLALGPIGGILGALAVSQMSKPGGVLGGPGLRTVDTMFGPIQAYQANRSLNSFPSAPSGGIRSATFSNRSAEGMRGISPRAAADISAGRGGLF